MLRNDYRRALILLRAVEPGLSGHVRLERRTLLASMHFLISGAPSSAEELEAALVARTDCGWKTAHVGTLRRDSRGQAGLGWSFDPRSIDGLALEQYSLVVIIGTQACFCRLLMTGYLNGAVDVDWDRVRQAVCSSYGFQSDGSGTPQPRDTDGDESAAPQPRDNADGEDSVAPQSRDMEMDTGAGASVYDVSDADARSSPMVSTHISPVAEESIDADFSSAASTPVFSNEADADLSSVESAPVSVETADDFPSSAASAPVSVETADDFSSSVKGAPVAERDPDAPSVPNDAAASVSSVTSPLEDGGATLPLFDASLPRDTDLDASTADPETAFDSPALEVFEGTVPAVEPTVFAERIVDDMLDSPAGWDAEGTALAAEPGTYAELSANDDFDLPAGRDFEGTAPAIDPAESFDRRAASGSGILDSAFAAQSEIEPSVSASAASPSTARAGTALAALGLDPSARWPESVEPLREVFAAAQPYTDFALDGYVFVRLPQGQQCPGCAVGVRALDGQVRSVAYAIPGISAEEPPAGLEGYHFRDGWWTVLANAETGALEA